MTWVVDASVAVSWFVEGPNTAAALRLIEADESLIAPDLLLVEVANTAWKLVRAGVIESDHGEAMSRSASEAFTEIVPAAELIHSAHRAAVELEHPVYDCLYLQLAMNRSAQLVTNDTRLLNKIAGTEWAHLAVSLEGVA